jgi:hypothetical protein
MRVGTWSSTLGKKYRLRVFQNKVLRNFSELIRNELPMERKNVHNKDTRALYYSSKITGVKKSMRMR